MKKPLVFTAILMSISTVLFACSKSEGGKSTIDSVYVVDATGKWIKETDVINLRKGNNCILSAKVTPPMAHMPSVSWESTNTAVVKVTASSTGATVEAAGDGQAQIVVRCEDKSCAVNVNVIKRDAGEMFYAEPSSAKTVADLQINGAGNYTSDGLLINKTGRDVKLNRFYALAERKAVYSFTPSADAVINFHSSEGDFQGVVDVPGKKIIIRSSPTWLQQSVSWLEGGKDYEVEVLHRYLTSSLKITELATGKSVEVSGDTDGCGGCGKGSRNPNTFSVGMHWDYYCIKLESGSDVTIRKIGVYALKPKVKLLIYGDSISQPEGYFMKNIFDRAWTQQIINRLGGDAMSSGRGGGNINTVLDYIKNELPFIEAEYVMVTIGTNGGNTASNLTELVNYIKSHGAIPILNNEPCNESASQVNDNKVISQVRQSCGIKGVRFDVATSLAGDGKEVDKTLMFWEDYTDYPAPLTGWQIYHHPNELGGDKMFQQALVDIPEIFD